jgi:antitoxin VapB
MVYITGRSMARKKKAIQPRSKGARVREPDATYAESAGDLRRASLFMNGRSQAVRLPKEFRFEGSHVYARKDGNRVILSPIDDRWERLLAAFGSIPDFPDRDQGTTQDRPEIDAWVNETD